MKLYDVKKLCYEFYLRFSTLPLGMYQLKFVTAPESVSISLISKRNEFDKAAILTITEDEVRILKINTFDDIDTIFIFDTPLELYTNLLTLMLVCCTASKVYIPAQDALNVTLCKKLKTWRELITFLCSLSPEDQGTILVQENHENALRLLRTSFSAEDGAFTTKGLYNSETPYKDVLDLIRISLEALSGLLKIHDYIIDPFFGKSIRD